MSLESLKAKVGELIEMAKKGGGVDFIEAKLLNGSYEYYNEKLTVVPKSGFNYDSFLTKCSLPNVTEIGSNTFYYCTNLTQVYFPRLQTAYNQAFGQTKLLDVRLPLLERLPNDAFNYCVLLEKADLPIIKQIGTYSFNRCNSLKQIVLRSATLVSLSNINAFNYCFHYFGTTDNTYNPNGLKDGYVYVPRNLIESYQTATNWSSLYANHENMFRALEDFTVDGTITGELDESKI